MLCTKKNANRAANQESTAFATGADFCRIFSDGMSNLYQLSFLLTANHSIAEKCFVLGLEDSTMGNTVFKEWAQSWARRTIIRNAIRMIQPRSNDGRLSSSAPDYGVRQLNTEPVEVAAIVELPAFERFAFVMSVLERYSDQECSLLLSCTRREVVAARVRALRQIGRSAENKLVRIQSDKSGTEKTEARLHLEPISHLPASA